MTPPPILTAPLVARLYERSRAARWALSLEAFTPALERSAARAIAGATPGRAEVEIERWSESLHVEDLALASACEAGIDAAWDHFVMEHRPALYRAADAVDPTGGARDLADSLYADLFGLRERDGARQSLFRYFHGRSSLSTWLRAVLAQRHVDRLRAGRRLDPLPDDESRPAVPAADNHSSPERPRFVAMMQAALADAIAALAPRDRLRLSCYYVQSLTLAAIGRLLGEHEATVSRHLARTRRVVRQAVEHHLRTVSGLDEAAIAECFASIVDDAGPLDLAELVGTTPDRKDDSLDRSQR
jgi:RNA polymerase sigma-70 factor, ECF subfamily